MNLRIKELAEQSGWMMSDEVEGFNIRLEKFAELIVRECIQVVDGMADPEEDSDCYVWTLYNACKKIKEHFGVKT